jgi:hypothetical protein
LRIEGVAYLPRLGEHPETWELPDGSIPLRVDFDPRRGPIGNATLAMRPDGTITCTAEVPEVTDDPVDELQLLRMHPKFAVSLVLPGGEGVYEGAQVCAVSIVHENQDTNIPPYAIEEERA